MPQSEDKVSQGVWGVEMAYRPAEPRCRDLLKRQKLPICKNKICSRLAWLIELQRPFNARSRVVNRWAGPKQPCFKRVKDRQTAMKEGNKQKGTSEPKSTELRDNPLSFQVVVTPSPT